MNNEEHILISMDERHAENILSGLKRIELRRRPMNVKVGTTIWIYAKLPVGSVIGKARVSAFYSLAPSTLWRRFSSVSGLSRGEFFEYFSGAPKGFALALECVERLARSTPLEELRLASSGFQPPQFFVRLEKGGSVLKVLETSTKEYSDQMVHA